MAIRKIAVVGAGFAGLAAAWHLSKRASLTLIDEGSGGGASQVAAGLLHPYAGGAAKFNFRGAEGMAATLPLLDAASEALGESVYRRGGILRVALTDQQEELFRLSSQRNDGVKWLTKGEARSMVPEMADRPAIWIPSGIAVFTDLYLKGLKMALESRGVSFIKGRVNSAEELARYDIRIFCAGAGLFSLAGLPDVGLRGVKGQLLELPWPDALPPLPLALNSKIYIVMSSCKKSCFVGSTFERDYISGASDQEAASRHLLPRLEELYPPLRGLSPIDCRAAIRVTAPNHLPIVKKVGSNSWLFTALGSKGLLYHSLFAEELAKMIA